MNYLLENIKTKLEAGLNQNDVRYIFIGKPQVIDEPRLIQGVITISPITTNVQSVTTGITDQESMSVQVTLMKTFKSDFYKNADRHSGGQYLMRVMDDRNADGSPKANTVRTIIRQNIRQLGLRQSEMDIAYDDDEIANEGAISATATFTVTNFNQNLLV